MSVAISNPIPTGAELYVAENANCAAPGALWRGASTGHGFICLHATFPDGKKGTVTVRTLALTNVIYAEARKLAEAWVGGVLR